MIPARGTVVHGNAARVFLHGSPYPHGSRWRRDYRGGPLSGERTGRANVDTAERREVRLRVVDVARWVAGEPEVIVLLVTTPAHGKRRDRGRG